ncbi:unnamed protein product, partial [Meganyctiphanes norvegica]
RRIARDSTVIWLSQGRTSRDHPDRDIVTRVKGQAPAQLGDDDSASIATHRDTSRRSSRGSLRRSQTTSSFLNDTFEEDSTMPSIIKTPPLSLVDDRNNY